MDNVEQPQIYLITPPAFELGQFPDTLAAVLDSVEIACVRMAISTRDEDAIARAADALREIAHARDVALVISDHVLLAERLGLDGVHLGDQSRSVRDARKTLGPDAIVGSFCAASRHEGISAGEAGADYISFGPVGSTALGDGTGASLELFQWWSEMIEIPVVAEGDLSPTLISQLAQHTDFFGVGQEIWDSENPVTALGALRAAMAAS